MNDVKRLTAPQLRVIVESVAKRQEFIKTAIRFAQSGNRIVYQDANGKQTVLWPGLGNRSGLHSFANTLIDEKWAASGDRFQKKLTSLPAAGVLIMMRYQNVTRDRGKWVVVSKNAMYDSPSDQRD